MAMSTVYSFRIPKQLKDTLEKLSEVDWQQELRTFLEQKVREEYVRKQLEEARDLRSKMKHAVNSAELIREDRENVQ
jgi:hypothetical protein